MALLGYARVSTEGQTLERRSLTPRPLGPNESSKRRSAGPLRTARNSGKLLPLLNPVMCSW